MREQPATQTVYYDGAEAGPSSNLAGEMGFESVSSPTLREQVLEQESEHAAPEYRWSGEGEAGPSTTRRAEQTARHVRFADEQEQQQVREEAPGESGYYASRTYTGDEEEGYVRQAYAEGIPGKFEYVERSEQQTEGAMKGGRPRPQQRWRIREGETDYISSMRETMDPDTTYMLVERLRDLIQQISGRPEAMRVLVSLVSTIAELGEITSASPEREQIPILAHEANRWAMMNDLKDLLDRFAGDYDTNGIIDVVDAFQQAYAEDWVLRDYLGEAGVFVSRSLRDPTYLYGRDYMPKGVHLIEKGRELFSTQYAELTNAFLNEFFNLAHGMRTDRTTNQMFDALQNLLAAVAIDYETGRYTLKMPLLKDLRTTFLPRLLRLCVICRCLVWSLKLRSIPSPWTTSSFVWITSFRIWSSLPSKIRSRFHRALTSPTLTS